VPRRSRSSAPASLRGPGGITVSVSSGVRPGDPLERVADPVVEELASSLAEVAGDELWALILFGSRLVGTTPGAHSAYDFVLIVDGYRSFYDRLHAAGLHGRPPALMTAISHVLSPNVVSVDPGLPGGHLAKVMVLTVEDFERALSPRAKDHFLQGRLVQTTALLRARDERAKASVKELLERARAHVIQWAGPWLPQEFTAADFAKRMLEVSYAGEIRPEAGGRVAAVFEAQRHYLEPAYRRVLTEAEQSGQVVRVGRPDDEPPRWKLAHPRGAGARARWRSYFIRSKIRATARWSKHIVTFDDWLSYIQKKVERRTGMEIELTPMERRLPLLLLWPKVFRVLRQVRRDRSESSR
jgi:hypothetical protein